VSVCAQQQLSTCAASVDVWPLSLQLPAGTLDSLARTLADDELQRAERFRFRRHAECFIAGRGQLRQILAGLMDGDPASLRFVYGPFGKPSLQGASSLRFNLSHTGELGLLIVAEGAELGVDVESDRGRDSCEQIARRFFASAEIEELMSLPAGERDAAFLRCWTRKEAYVKALGGGLQLALDAFAVSLAAGEPPRLRSCALGEDELRRWTLIDLSYACAGATAAACVEGRVGDVRLHSELT
jgi:4'-phosphopantetheinyl transferase